MFDLILLLKYITLRKLHAYYENYTFAMKTGPIFTQEIAADLRISNAQPWKLKKRR
jgi:hypothetical protein